jgi:hypothetical protein
VQVRKSHWQVFGTKGKAVLFIVYENKSSASLVPPNKSSADAPKPNAVSFFLAGSSFGFSCSSEARGVTSFGLSFFEGEAEPKSRSPLRGSSSPHKLAKGSFFVFAEKS